MNTAEKLQRLLDKGRVEGSELYNFQIGLWDCEECGTVGILAIHKNCQNCGSSKSDQEEQAEYCPDDALYYTEEQISEMVDVANPDWICEHCKNVNSHRLDNCSGCSAARTNKRTLPMQFDLDEVPQSAREAKDAYKRATEPVSTDIYSSYNNVGMGEPSLVGKNLKKIVLGFLAVLSFGWLFYLFFLETNVVEARVNAIHWKRQIIIEQLTTVIEEDWSVPGGGRQLSSRQAVRDHKQVSDGYETKTRSVRVQTGTTTSRYPCGKTKTGSGAWQTNYCTSTTPVYGTKTETYREPKYRSVPIYDTLYRYEIDKWIASRTLKEEGVDKNPIWPDLGFLGGKEREGARTEVFEVELVDPTGKTYQFSVPWNKWVAVEFGQTYQLQVTRAGGASNPLQ